MIGNKKNGHLIRANLGSDGTIDVETLYGVVPFNSM